MRHREIILGGYTFSYSNLKINCTRYTFSFGIKKIIPGTRFHEVQGNYYTRF